jgi:hypothetical protein
LLLGFVGSACRPCMPETKLNSMRHTESTRPTAAINANQRYFRTVSIPHLPSRRCARGYS